MSEPIAEILSASPLVRQWEQRAKDWEALSPAEKDARNAAWRQIEAEQRAKRNAARAVNLLGASGIPKRQADTNPDHKTAWGAKCATLLGLVEKNATIGIVGGRGNGKTQMAVEAVKQTCAAGKSALFTSAINFFMEIKASYAVDAKRDERAIVAAFTRPHLLVIDEIGKRGGSDWENNLLFEVLNRRYENMTPSIVIDNRTKAEFITTIGPSLASRMTEGGGIIECTWESFR